METAMLKVKTDLLNAIDQKKVVCLVLLDLSAAFDTVNHDYLLNCLRKVQLSPGSQITSQNEHREWFSMAYKVMFNLIQ